MMTPANNIFKPLTPLKVSDAIVAHFKSLIKIGALAPGEKLPAERTLAGLLGVGRSTLREAMNILATLGLIEIKKRRGAFVKSLGESVLPDALTQIMEADHARIKDLYELRVDLEVASAFMAAEHRTAQDLISMRNLLETMEKQITAPRLGIDEDIQFHLAVGRASRNVLRVHVLENLFRRYGHYIAIARRPFSAGQRHNRMICDHHRAVYAAIEKHDSEAARTAMVDHLTMVSGQWD